MTNTQEQLTTLQATRRGLKAEHDATARALGEALTAGKDTGKLESKLASINARLAGLAPALASLDDRIKSDEIAAMLATYEGYSRQMVDAMTREAARKAQIAELQAQIRALQAEQAQDDSSLQTTRGKKLALLREGMRRGISTQLHQIDARLQKQAREQAKQPENVPS